jgi:hypothetical protein
MSHKQALSVLIIAGFVAVSGVVNADDALSKKSEPTGTAPSQNAAPKSESVEAKPKSAKPVKWDQLDPKQLEQRAKKNQPTSPLSGAPAER